jgi:hypothetical protein
VGQPKPDEEGDGNSHTNVGHAFIARAATNNTSDKFIVDTGCIGSHVFKNSKPHVSPNTSKSIKDFSGTAHQSSVKGHLLSTSQKVLVMEESKVNLLST